MSTTAPRFLSSTAPENESTASHKPHATYDPLAEERRDRKFEAIARLGANWDHEGAETPALEVINAARLFCNRLVCIPEPSILPTVDGGVQLEWSCRGRVLEIEFEDAETVTYIKWNPSTGTSDEGELPWPPNELNADALNLEFNELMAWLRTE